MWLHIPHARTALTASRSVQGQAALNWDLISQQHPTALSVMSSGTHTQRPLSWRGWRTRAYMTRLSGLTLAPSTAARGAAAWISSRPATPASPSRCPGGARAMPTRAISGRRSSASFVNARRRLSSVRTSRATSPWDFPKSPAAYSGWAMASGRACSLRQRRARPTSGAGSSFWPTPTVGMSGNRVEMKIDALGLRYQVAADIRGNQIAIMECAKVWTLAWLWAKGMGLAPAARPECRSSLPLHVSLQFGTRYSAGTLRFNPAFSDWLMGWPIGWSDPCSPVTGFAQWRRRSRSALLDAEFRLWSVISGGEGSDAAA